MKIGDKAEDAIIWLVGFTIYTVILVTCIAVLSAIAGGGYLVIKELLK